MKATPIKSMSASEIAKNIKSFEQWSSCCGLNQVELNDLPLPLRDDVASVFALKGKLPLNWVLEPTDSDNSIKTTHPSLHKLLRAAYLKKPDLFSESASEDEDLLLELSAVCLAWNKIKKMRRSGERCSEADYAASVYNILRGSAVKKSSLRAECSIHLPRHLKGQSCDKSAPGPKSVVPDGGMFIKNHDIRSLSIPRNSAFKIMKMHSSTRVSCPLESDNAFCYQATPCVQTQQNPCFEFASAFWEDKKPGSDSLDHAYRQNRMACSSAIRHLEALHIQAPVFGLLWAEGRVKAHVDWFECDDNNVSIVHSAPYPGPLDGEESRRSSCTGDVLPFMEFYEWDLSNGADIISVFLVLRNLDVWTSVTFKERVEEGVRAFAKDILEGKRTYSPWKDSSRAPAVLVTRSKSAKENTPPESTVTASTSTASSGGYTPTRIQRQRAAKNRARTPGCYRV